MAEQRDIKYVAREFSDYKQELIEFAKNYFPDSYNDFSPTSPGMMFIEMAAYVGDILSFYQDTQLQETFLQYAKDPGNLYSMAYMMGYRPKTTTVSEVELTFTQDIGADPVSNEPNWDQALIVDENTIMEISTFVAKGQSFEASDGNHDDLMMNLVMFGYFATSNYFNDLTNINLKEMMFEKRMREIEDDVVPFGFTNDGLEDIPVREEDNPWAVEYAHDI